MLEGMEGKVALVTGAGAGLGRAHALELGRQGVKVVVNDFGAARGASPADAVVDEIKAAGGDAVAHGGDVANWDDAKAMVQLASTRTGASTSSSTTPGSSATG